MRLLAIDPGETVGWAVYDGLRKVDGGQTPFAEFIDQLVITLTSERYIPEAGRVMTPAGRPAFFKDIDHIVCEDFLIYPPGVGPGPPPPWDPVITARLIGAIQVLADIAGIKVEYQGAKIKSDALKAAAEVDFVRPLHENRHENDAVMHATYWLARQQA